MDLANPQAIISLIQKAIDESQTIKDIKADLVTIKQDVAVLKADVSVLKADVAVLKSDVSSLKDWQKKMSTSAEMSYNEFFEEEFRKHCTTNSIQQIYMNDLYSPRDGTILTEFDGLFEVKQSHDMPDRNLTKDLKIAKAKIGKLKINTSSDGKTFLIIIETKLSFDKRHIDNKIKKYKDVAATFDIAKGNVSTCHPLFKELVKQFDLFQKEAEIVLIFASDALPKKIVQYLDDINSGIMTEDLYKMHTFNILQEDKTFQEFTTACYMFKSKNKPKSVGKPVTQVFDYYLKNKILTYDSLVQCVQDVSALNLDSLEIDSSKYLDFTILLQTIQKSIQYLQKATTPYTDMLPYFETVKSKLGYIKQKKIVSPVLSNITVA